MKKSDLIHSLFSHSVSHGEVVLPEGEIFTDLQARPILPCARSSTSDYLTWHFLKDGVSTKIYDSASLEVAEGYSVPFDIPDMLVFDSHVQRVGEEHLGHYTCIIHRLPSNPPQFEFGTVHLRLQLEGMHLSTISSISNCCVVIMMVELLK